MVIFPKDLEHSRKVTHTMLVNYMADREHKFTDVVRQNPFLNVKLVAAFYRRPNSAQDSSVAKIAEALHYLFFPSKNLNRSEEHTG